MSPNGDNLVQYATHYIRFVDDVTGSHGTFSASHIFLHASELAIIMLIQLSLAYVAFSAIMLKIIYYI